MRTSKKLFICLLGSLIFIGPVYGQNSSTNGNETVALGRVAGRITTDVSAHTAGYVSFYRASDKNAGLAAILCWKKPDFGFYLDKNGSFDIELPEGIYFMTAVRTARIQAGPPEDGDHVLLFADGKTPISVTVRENIKIDIGEKKTLPISSLIKQSREITKIKGVILDEAGKPVPGIYVVAHLTPGTFKPDYVSTRSDKDGSFEIRFPGGGQYFLLARHKLGPPPVSGEIYVDEMRETAPVEIKTGETIKKNMRVKKIKMPVKAE